MDEVPLRIVDVSIELKLPGAKNTNRDSATFTTIDRVIPGQAVKIQIKSHDGRTHADNSSTLFEGEVKSVTLVRRGAMIHSMATCGA